MRGSLVADLGFGPEAWVFLALLGCLTLFFKFSRFWSIRNLDLLLLFAPAPGLMRLVGGGEQPWWAYGWLFVGSACWLLRCLIDVGLARRPILEPNLNFAGLVCLALGISALLVIETVSLPLDEGAKRNPADPHEKRDPAEEAKTSAIDRNPAVKAVLKHTPLPSPLRRYEAGTVLSRALAVLAHLGLILGLIAIGWRHFDRPITGLAMATCYLIVPYTRIALVDSGQLIPAALLVGAVVSYNRPGWSGLLIGLSAGWMPPSLGLLPLWTGFYRGRQRWVFLAVAVGVIAACLLGAKTLPNLAGWARALGARSLADAGLLPTAEDPIRGSFWTRIDPVYRLPVLIGYGALVAVLAFVPSGKNLGTLVALSAALMVASQFWYLDKGGTLVLLYLPLLLIVMFRPNLSTKLPHASPPRAGRYERSASSAA